MKKRIGLLLLLSIGMISSTTAQRKKKKEMMWGATVDVTDQLKAMHTKAYRHALKLGDANTAIVSLTNLLALDTTEFSTYRDSLSILYFRSGKYAQSYALSKTLTEENEGNTFQLEIYAQSMRELGGYKEAIPVYEKLLRTKPSRLYAYQLGDMQSKLERDKEAFNTFRAAINIKQDTSYSVGVDAGNNRVQQVKLKAVIYNMLGVTAYKLNKENASIAYQFFAKAVGEQNDFVLARENANQTKKVLNESVNTDIKK